MEDLYPVIEYQMSATNFGEPVDYLTEIEGRVIEYDYYEKAFGSGQIDYSFDVTKGQTLALDQVKRLASRLDRVTRDLKLGEVRNPIEEEFDN